MKIYNILDLRTNKIVNLAPGTADTDAVNVSQLRDNITAAQIWQRDDQNNAYRIDRVGVGRDSEWLQSSIAQKFNVGGVASIADDSNNIHIEGAGASGKRNVLIGFDVAENSTTTSNRSVLIGINVARYASQVRNTVAIGNYAAEQSKILTHSIAIGTAAAQHVEYGTIIAIGNQAGAYSEGDGNVFIGHSAGVEAKQATNNTVISGGTNMSGAENFLAGQAGNFLVGDFNVGLGKRALEFAQGNSNTVISSFAARWVAGDSNLLLGTAAGEFVKGSENVAIGAYAAQLAQGNNNYILGSGNARYNRGDNNTLVGANIMTDAVLSSDTVVFPASAFVDNIVNHAHGLPVGERYTVQYTATTSNPFEMYLARTGSNNRVPTTLNEFFVIETTSSNSFTIIDAVLSFAGKGDHTLTLVGGYSNVTAIGANAIVDRSNQLVIGNEDITEFKVGKIRIQTDAQPLPNYALVWNNTAGQYQPRDLNDLITIPEYWEILSNNRLQNRSNRQVIISTATGATRFSGNRIEPNDYGQNSELKLLATHLSVGEFASFANLSRNTALHNIIGSSNNKVLSYTGDNNNRSYIRTTLQTNSLTHVIYQNQQPRFFLGNSGNIGIHTISPTRTLHVNGTFQVNGAIYDSTGSTGSNGQLLSTTASGTRWISPAGVQTYWQRVEGVSADRIENSNAERVQINNSLLITAHSNGAALIVQDDAQFNGSFRNAESNFYGNEGQVWTRIANGKMGWRTPEGSSSAFTYETEGTGSSQIWFWKSTPEPLVVGNVTGNDVLGKFTIHGDLAVNNGAYHLYNNKTRRFGLNYDSSTGGIAMNLTEGSAPFLQAYAGTIQLNEPTFIDESISIFRDAAQSYIYASAVNPRLHLSVYDEGSDRDSTGITLTSSGNVLLPSTAVEANDNNAAGYLWMDNAKQIHASPISIPEVPSGPTFFVARNGYQDLPANTESVVVWEYFGYNKGGAYNTSTKKVNITQLGYYNLRVSFYPDMEVETLINVGFYVGSTALGGRTIQHHNTSSSGSHEVSIIAQIATTGELAVTMKADTADARFRFVRFYGSFIDTL